MMFQSVFAQEMSDFMAIKEAEGGMDNVYRYRFSLARFDQYLIDIHLSEKEISEDIIAEWIKTLGGKSKTISTKISRLRNFIKYLRAIGISAFLPNLHRAPSAYVPYIFSEDELNAIFSAADNFAQPYQSSYPYLHNEMPMLLRLLFGCGLRRGEALSLIMRDVDLQHGVLTLKKAKGEKERLVPMNSSLSEILRRYCSAMKLVGYPERCLFPGRTLTDPLAGGAAQTAFRSILALCSIALAAKEKQQRGPCLHCFRHVFVIKSILQAEQEGRSLNSYDIALPTYLGHEDFRDTDEYIHLNTAMLTETAVAFEKYTKGIIPEVLYEEE